jgi:hypothetical protein
MRKLWGVDDCGKAKSYLVKTDINIETVKGVSYQKKNQIFRPIWHNNISSCITRG